VSLIPTAVLPAADHQHPDFDCPCPIQTARVPPLTINGKYPANSQHQYHTSYNCNAFHRHPPIDIIDASPYLTIRPETPIPQISQSIFVNWQNNLHINNSIPYPMPEFLPA
jgi:hypothetical protein